LTESLEAKQEYPEFIDFETIGSPSEKQDIDTWWQSLSDEDKRLFLCIPERKPRPKWLSWLLRQPAEL
jgi:hypothetical protein